MKALDGRRVAVVPGDGVVGRSEHALVIAHGAPDAIDALLADASLRSSTGVDRLRRMVTEGLPQGIAGMIVVTAGDGLDVASAGPEHVSVDGVDPQAQRQGAALVRALTTDDEIRLGVPFGRVGAALDLRDGLVPGAGVVLSSAASDGAAASDDATQPPEVSDVGGSPSDATSGEPVRGRLVFDDGTTFTLDRSYLIGRELPDSGDPSLAPLVVDDAEHSVSRRHAEVRLDGWDVVVRDLGSSNGTRVWDPRAATWQRLETGRSLVLEHGTYVAVGRRVFVFEPPMRRASGAGDG